MKKIWILIGIGISILVLVIGFYRTDFNEFQTSTGYICMELSTETEPIVWDCTEEGYRDYMWNNGNGRYAGEYKCDTLLCKGWQEDCPNVKLACNSCC